MSVARDIIFKHLRENSSKGFNNSGCKAVLSLCLDEPLEVDRHFFWHKLERELSDYGVLPLADDDGSHLGRVYAEGWEVNSGTQALKKIFELVIAEDGKEIREEDFL